MNTSQSYETSPAIWDPQCYLPPETGAPPPPQASRPVLDLPNPEGWKAELAWVTWLNTKTVYPQTTVTHLSTNPARRRVEMTMGMGNPMGMGQSWEF